MPRFSQVFLVCFASSTALLANATPQSFYWQTYQPEINPIIYEKCGKVCPDIDYNLIDTGNPWLDAPINKAVVNSFEGMNEDSAHVKASYKKFNAIPIPTPAQYTQQLSQAIAVLVAENKSSIEKRGKDWVENSSPPIQQTAIPKYLGHKTLGDNNLELMQLETYAYSGGAHGLGTTTYYMFDMANQRQLTLANMLLPNQKANLEKALKAKFIDWIKQNKEDPTDYQKMWQFHVTDNVIFTKDGIRFVYQPYEISPYAYGMPEFTLTYAELKGVVKPEYLQ